MIRTTVVQSHPSSPFALTALTETSAPGSMPDSVAFGCATLVCARSERDAGPYATRYPVTSFSGPGVHVSDALPPLTSVTFRSATREGLDASSMMVAAVVLATSVTS